MKKTVKILIIVFVILIVLIGGVYALFFSSFGKHSNNGGGVVMENPMKKIVDANKDASGKINEQAVIKQGVAEFNVDYINYILLALGVGNLQSSVVFGNPVVELGLDNEVWSSEIKDNSLNTKIGANDNKDLRVTMSKEEAVRALLSYDIKQFMKDSVNNGNTKIEMIAGKPELLAKGYLTMYNGLKG
jgi:hypothetical protein